MSNPTNRELAERLIREVFFEAGGVDVFDYEGQSIEEIEIEELERRIIAFLNAQLPEHDTRILDAAGKERR